MSCIWVVPSVVIPREHNIILFPGASGFSADIVHMEPFEFDTRLISRIG
jgi:hypothetical protein